MKAEEQDHDCSEALAAMYQFLDQELTAADRVEVQRHLDGCIPCLEAFEFEAELKTVIADRCKDEVPEHLYVRIRSILKIECDSTSQFTAADSAENLAPNSGDDDANGEGILRN